MFLAKVIGWYFVIMGLFLIARQQTLKTAINELVSDSALMVVVGAITLILGLILVIAHNVWVIGWPVIITVIAWLVLIGGLLRLFAPELGIRMAKGWLKNPRYFIVAALVYIIVGLYLLYRAYFA
ncbi:hypothetical protein [Legionella micdadei]|nr:hypothetical protein [Legionella micdadei]